MPPHRFRELREARAAAEKYLSEWKSTLRNLLAQTLGKFLADQPTLSALSAQYDLAEEKLDPERRQWTGRIIPENERKELEKDEVLLEGYKKEIKTLKELFLMSPAQGDSSSGVGGGQGADAVTLSP